MKMNQDCGFDVSKRIQNTRITILTLYHAILTSQLSFKMVYSEIETSFHSKPP